MNQNSLFTRLWQHFFYSLTLLISIYSRQHNVEENMTIAMEEAPESFGQVVMLYINCKVNGHPVKAFVDSGNEHFNLSPFVIVKVSWSSMEILLKCCCAIYWFIYCLWLRDK